MQISLIYISVFIKERGPGSVTECWYASEPRVRLYISHGAVCE